VTIENKSLGMGREVLVFVNVTFDQNDFEVATGWEHSLAVATTKKYKILYNYILYPTVAIVAIIFL